MIRFARCPVRLHFLVIIALFSLSPPAAAPVRAQNETALSHAALGSAAEADGNWAQALSEYSLAFQSDTTSSYLLGRVVHCVFELGRDDEVMSLTGVLWKRDSTQDEAADDAGEMAFTHGRMDEAGQWFAAAARARPGAADHWVHLALVHERLGHLPEAESALERACKAEPDQPQALYHLGLVRAEAGHEDRAAQPLSHLAEVAPDFPHGLILLAQVQENTHALAQAHDSYARALQVSDDPEDQEEARRGLARVAFFRGRPEEALAPLSGLIAEHPADLGLRRLRLQADMKLRRDSDAMADLDTLTRVDADNPAWPSAQAQLWNRMGKPDRARETARRFQSRHPDSYRSYEMLGAVEFDQRHYDEALKQLDRAHLLAPDSASVPYLRGQVLGAAGRNAEAERAFLEATRLDPTYLEAFFSLGVSRERQGHLDSAEVAFRKVLALDPRNATALNYIGYMYADRGLRLEESLKDIEQALQQEPDNSAFLDSKGWVLYRLGRWEEARQGLEEAIQKGGRDSLIREHLGDVLVALKRYREAAAAYQDALHGDPRNSQLKHKLRDLDPQLH